jgi:hypothetical protein
MVRESDPRPNDTRTIVKEQKYHRCTRNSAKRSIFSTNKLDERSRMNRELSITRSKRELKQKLIAIRLQAPALPRQEHFIANHPPLESRAKRKTNQSQKLPSRSPSQPQICSAASSALAAAAPSSCLRHVSPPPLTPF